MSSTIIKGIYRHTTSKKLYDVIGVGRSVENPEKLVVIYKQMDESTLNNTNIRLPKGSLWTRDLNDFMSVIDNNNTRRFTKVIE